MGKSLTVTSKSDIATLPAATRRAITSAFKALAATEAPKTKRYAAIKAVGTLRGLGYSVRGVVAVLSVEGNGHLPVSKGAIERYGYVADAIAGEWPELGDSRDAVIDSLYVIAQTGKAGDVARAAELGRKASDGETAYAAVESVRHEVANAQHKSLTTEAQRAVGGEAADGGKAPAEAGEDAAQSDAAPVKAERDISRELGAYTLTSLLTEAVKRTAVTGFYADADISALIATLAERAEASADTHSGAEAEPTATEAVKPAARKRRTVKANA